MDFSIYQQGIYDILTLKEWNPYLTIRNINLFNDHFVPIFYLTVFFTGVFGQGFQQLLIFEWLFLLGLIISICYIYRSDISKSIPYIFCTLTTTLLLAPLLYPIHPDTWSCLPLFWLTYVILKKKISAVPILVFSTCLFKESFAFAFFPLGIFYIAKKELKTGAMTTLIASLFIFNELYFREYLLGSTIDYGDKFFKSFFNNPFLFFIKILFNLNNIVFLKKFYPFIFCLLFFLKKSNKASEVFRICLPVLLVFTSLFVLQTYYNLIEHQYGAPFAGILIALMVSFDALHQISKKQKIFVLSLFALSSLGTYTRYFNRLLLSNYKDKCIIESDKLTDNKVIRSHISRLSSSSTVLATGGIIPFIMMPNKKIFHYKGFSQEKISYDYLILEKNKSGDIWRATEEEIQNVILNCKELAEEIYLNNKYFFFARGKFENCVY